MSGRPANRARLDEIGFVWDSAQNTFETVVVLALEWYGREHDGDNYGRALSVRDGGDGVPGGAAAGARSSVPAREDHGQHPITAGRLRVGPENRARLEEMIK